MSRLREVALALHALVPEDRTWLIERLSPAQQRAVEPLIAELHDLGIPADAHLVDQALRRGAHEVARSAQQRIAALRAPRAAELLHGEPASFVACFLGLTAWPWTREYVATLDASAQQQLKQAMHDAPEASAALRAWLMEAIAVRIDAAAIDGPARLALSAGDTR